MNYGVLPIKIKNTDYVAGTIKYENRNVDWGKYLPKKELQSPPETMSCVPFSILKNVAMQINYLIDVGKINKADVKDWIDETGSINFSDRYLAIKSGTTKEGNKLQDVLDTFRKYGCPPDKDLPFGGNTWEKYHNKKLITPELDAKALKILDYIDVGYEWSWTNGADYKFILPYELKHAPVQVAGTVCAGWDNEYVPTCPVRNYQHAVSIYKYIKPKVYISDQYEPVLKTMDNDYPFLCGLKIVVVEDKILLNEKRTLELENGGKLTDTLPAKVWEFIKNYLTKLGVKFKETVGAILK